MPGLVAVPDTMRKVARAMVDVHIQKHGGFPRRGRLVSSGADGAQNEKMVVKTGSRLEGDRA
eukprot:13830156-Heterocapsa_arctica.AAC.1